MVAEKAKAFMNSYKWKAFLFKHNLLHFFFPKFHQGQYSIFTSYSNHADIWNKHLNPCAFNRCHNMITFTAECNCNEEPLKICGSQGLSNSNLITSVCSIFGFWKNNQERRLVWSSWKKLRQSSLSHTLLVWLLWTELETFVLFNRSNLAHVSNNEIWTKQNNVTRFL